MYTCNTMPTHRDLHTVSGLFVSSYVHLLWIGLKSISHYYVFIINVGYVVRQKAAAVTG